MKNKKPSSALTFPALLPSMKDGRAKLREARAAYSEASDRVAGFRAALKAGRDLATSVEAQLYEVERAFLDAPDDSPEAGRNEMEIAKLWKRLRLAEAGIENLETTLESARLDLNQAERALHAAREDIEAIQEGRRKR